MHDRGMFKGQEVAVKIAHIRSSVGLSSTTCNNGAGLQVAVGSGNDALIMTPARSDAVTKAFVPQQHESLASPNGGNNSGIALPAASVQSDSNSYWNNYLEAWAEQDAELSQGLLSQQINPFSSRALGFLGPSQGIDWLLTAHLALPGPLRCYPSPPHQMPVADTSDTKSIGIRMTAA